ncbi:hypothetical protein [Thalassospira sp.]|uniref:hypothetical protein n=1 Tax=Thalassospira sp. TaxID=1912094 RepID=UPI000C3D5FC0|nr:hypothetical protein [Thalassospira sp.]MBC06368.1 hypothetical protein [Thalassospira sp.]|tara:strand:+ start:1982 stop:2566 length:585 start_codon:yes stop_codon:yes gene_type:complete
MKRIDTQTKATDKFGPGKHGFTNGNPTIPTPATELDESWFDHVQEEIANFIEEQGIVLDANNRTQLAAAITAKLANGNYLRGNVSSTLTAGFWTTPVAATVNAGDVTLPVASGNRFTLTATEALTILAPDPMPAGGSARLELTIDAVGNHAISWGAGFRVNHGQIDTDPNVVNLIHMEFTGALIDVHITQRAEA